MEKSIFDCIAEQFPNGVGFAGSDKGDGDYISMEERKAQKRAATDVLTYSLAGDPERRAELRDTFSSDEKALAYAKEVGVHEKCIESPGYAAYARKQIGRVCDLAEGAARKPGNA